MPGKCPRGLGWRRKNKQGDKPSSAHRVINTVGGCRASWEGVREERDTSPHPWQKSSSPALYDCSLKPVPTAPAPWCQAPTHACTVPASPAETHSL